MKVFEKHLKKGTSRPSFCMAISAIPLLAYKCTTRILESSEILQLRSLDNLTKTLYQNLCLVPSKTQIMA